MIHFNLTGFINGNSSLAADMMDAIKSVMLQHSSIDTLVGHYSGA